MSIVNKFETELIQVLFRHGARTCSPMEITRAMSEHVDPELHATYGYMQLTNRGKAQMYKLGQALRRRFDELLGPLHRPRDLCCRSTDYERTAMSLQLVLAGLYPPAPDQAWHPSLDWMPLPYAVVPKDLDFVLCGFEKPRYFRQLSQAMKAYPSDDSLPELTEIEDYLKNDGAKRFFPTSFCVHNVLNTHKKEETSLPDWYSDDLLASLRKHVVHFLDTMSSTVELKKTISGPLVKTVLKNMNVKDEADNPRKAYLYSAHEFNVAAFLRAHGIKEMPYPDFGSAVVVEKLRDPDGQLFVRMLAWTGYEDDFFTLKLGDSGDVCPIDEYVKIVQDIIPSEEEMEEIYKDAKVDLNKINTTDFVYRPNY